MPNISIDIPQYIYQYYTEVRVSDTSIKNFFKPLFEKASINGTKVTLNGVLADHLDGDKYFLRAKMGRSYSSNLNDKTAFGGYQSVGDSPAYTQQTSPVILDVGVNAFDRTDVVGRKIKFHLPQDGTEVKTWVSETEYTSGEIVYSDGHYYLCIKSGTSGPTQPIHTTGVMSDGAIVWRYLHSGTGSATITSVKSPTELTAVADSYLPVLKWGQESYIWENFQWSMWGYEGVWPSQVFLYKGRLCYTFDAPGYGSYFCASKIDMYNDFGTDNFGEVLDTSGINIILSGHSDNRVNWVLPGNKLYLGSYAGEYNIVGDNSGALTPISINVLPVSSIGGAKVPALKFEELNLFVGALRTELYAMRYDYSGDDFSPQNVGFSNTSILYDKITRMQALKNTDRNIYFTTDSKQVRVLNNSREAKRLGFYRTNLNGDILDIASSSSGERSLLFALVKRNGVVTVEVLTSESPTYMLSARRFDNREKGYNVPSTITQPDLSEKDVYVKNLEDGQFYKTTASVNGDIDNRFNTKLLEVGLPMECKLHCMPSYNSKIEGAQQKSVRFLVRLLDSGAFSYGSSHDFTKWYDYNNWNIADGQEWSSGHRLMTGDLQLPSSFGYMQGQNTADGLYPNDTGVGLNLKSETPEPFNLLMVSSIYV